MDQVTTHRGDDMTHLSPEVLAAYLDDELSREQRSQVELHLASCDECRAELADINRLQRARVRRRWLSVLVPAAAAAALVLVIALPRDRTKPSDIRSRPDVSDRLLIVSPAPSAEIAPRPINFVWRSAGPDASYTITLQEAEGRPVWTSSVADTVVALPDSITLAPGRRWFWFVDALLPNGRSLSTGVQRLTTAP
jgi:anti-sigma factor RsiW